MRGSTTSLLAAVVAACGGDGATAPATADLDLCPAADAYLEDVFALMDAGGLEHLRTTMGEGLSEDQRDAFVASLLDLVRAFPPGTFTDVGPVAELVTGLVELESLLADLLRFAAEGGPGAPYPEAMAGVRAVLQTCEGPAVMALLRDVLADDALLRALLTVLGEVDLGALLGDLEFDEKEGREAVRALVRNLLAAATAGDFEIDVWIDALGLVVDLEAAPWPDLVSGLESFVVPGTRLDAVRGLSACLLAADPDLRLVDMPFDAIAAGAVDVASLAAGLPPVEEGAPVVPPALAIRLEAILTFLEGDSKARRALADVLAEMLSPETAPGVLLDTAALLETDLLGDLFLLVEALTTGTCPP